MSRMMISNRKPPVPRSPIRLRPRRVLQSSTNIMQAPPGSLTKTQLSKCTWDAEEVELWPEYRTISCELRALAKIVQEEFKDSEMGNAGIGDSSNANRRSPLFERGRFYEEYSARRNERLKRKKGLTRDEKKNVYDLGVRVESAKKTETKKFESLRRAVPSTPLTERRENPRYSLRSSIGKETKKPPSVSVTERKIGVRRIRKI